ncbi:MAG: helix-turn-helix domain-containing protein [Ruminococcus sp.]|nr:helix-turn-helix domain-containing protein [Ruminococcus sp.]MCM1381407.1 helix-turn-helix domain-containing protein [Muribaculaceae bacterium]MCM1479298.1 helix-turn-helix domain-containing protein [Muribaculaceae bacterium]
MIDIEKPHMLTVNETAKEFGLPANLIRAKAKSGEIKAIRQNSRLYINAEAFAEYLWSQYVNPREPEPIRHDAQESNVVRGITPIPLKLKF